MSSFGRSEDAIGQMIDVRKASVEHEIAHAILRRGIVPPRYVQVDNQNFGHRSAQQMDQLGSPMTPEKRAELAAERLKTAIRDDKGEIIGYPDQKLDTEANWDAADWSTPKTFRKTREATAGGPPGPLLQSQPIAAQHLAVLRELGLIPDTPHAAPEPRTVPEHRRVPDDGRGGQQRPAVGQRELDGFLGTQWQVGWGVPAPRDGRQPADREPAGDPADPARPRGGVPEGSGEVR